MFINLEDLAKFQVWRLRLRNAIFSLYMNKRKLAFYSIKC